MALFRGEQKKDNFKFHPRVHHFQSLVFGRPMHPLVGLDKYRELIAANPKDATPWMRMDNLFRTLHRYPQAREAFRQGYILGTDNPEYVMAYAMAEHDFGDRATAKKLYDEAIILASKRLLRSPSAAFDMLQAAQSGLKLLAQGKASPWELNVVKGGAQSTPQPTPPPPRNKRVKSKSKSKKHKRKK